MGFYYAYPMDEKGMLGWRRKIEIGTKIVVRPSDCTYVEKAKT